MLVSLIVEQSFFQSIQLVILNSIQRLPDGILCIHLLQGIQGGITELRQENHIGIEGIQVFHIHFDAGGSAFAVGINGIDATQFLQDDTGLGIHSVCLQHIGGQHQNHGSGRLFNLGNLGNDTDDIVSSGLSNRLPQFRLTVQVAEDLEPLQIVLNGVIVDTDNGNVGGSSRTGNGGIALHASGADNQVGLTADNLFHIPVGTGGAFGDDGNALILGDIVTDLLLISGDSTLAANSQLNSAASFIPQGSQATKQNSHLLGVLGNSHLCTAAVIGENNVSIGDLHLVGLLQVILNNFVVHCGLSRSRICRSGGCRGSRCRSSGLGRSFSGGIIAAGSSQRQHHHGSKHQCDQSFHKNCLFSSYFYAYRVL